jgi:type 1 fimbria pilin
MMLHRVLPLLAILAVICLVSAPALAADEKTVEGTVVKAGGGKLMITGTDKKPHACNVADDAKITCDGKECKLADLKKGVKVKVTVEGKGKKAKATKIEASTK